MDISRLNVSAARRHVTAILAIDTSGSMCSTHTSGFGWRSRRTSRLEAASRGASSVLNSLQDGDHASVLAFSSELKDVSGGAVELSAATKVGLGRKLEALRPSGMTALYDTVLGGCKLVLSISAAANLMGRAARADMGTFWLVILTDGEDTCSKSCLSDAQDVLRQIGARLGELMKVVFIGVALNSGPKGKLESLAAAGGKIATFVDAKGVDGIKHAFDEITMQIRMTRISIGSAGAAVPSATASPVELSDDAGAPSSWPGEVQRGAHVRCVGHSRGRGNVDVGDVGVVRAREVDGSYRIDFPSHQGWRGRPADVAVDAIAEEVRPGAVVTVRASVTSPKFGWGSVERGMRGLVHSVEGDATVLVQFGLGGGAGGAKSSLWKSQLSELQAVSDDQGPWVGHLQMGQAVRVPLRLGEPSTKWGNLQKGEVGYVRSQKVVLGERVYTCDFPSVDGWQGRESDLEVEAISDLVRPGKKVRVRRGIASPKYGWAKGQTHESVGTVVSVRYDGHPVVVDFPENRRWKGALSELETLDGPRTERATRTAAGGVKTCVGGHGLKPLPTVGTDCKVCDFCGERSGPQGTLMYGCTICDTDACPRCYNVSQSPSMSPQSSASSQSSGTRKFAVGTKVLIRSLSSSAGAPLNGKAAKVISHDGGDGKYTVQLIGDGNETYKLKEACLVEPLVQKFANGATVTIRGLNSVAGAPLNGKMATVISYGESDGKYAVQLPGESRTVKVREDCLMVPSQQHPNGTLVRLHGISGRPALNGRLGAIRSFNSTTGRYEVDCVPDIHAGVSSERVAILPSKFEVLPSAEELD